MSLKASATHMRLISALLLVLVLLGGASPAFAHASLVASQPADGSVLAEPPRQVEMRFDEPVSASVVHLVDAAGKTRSDIEVEAKDDRIDVKLPADLPRGTNVLSWHVVSADGHPVAGSLIFSIGAPSGGRASAERLDPMVAMLIWLTRLGVYLGLLVGVGGAFFLSAVARMRVARAGILAALGIGLLCAALALGLQGVDLLGATVSGLLTAAAWSLAIGTSLGPSLGIAGAAMLLAALSLAWREGPKSVLASGLALLGVGAALAASGHAAAAKLQWLTRPALFIHTVGVAYWVGALLPLIAVLRRPSEEALQILDRFSRIALPVVATLLICGAVLVFAELPDVSALLDSAYGRILAAKLVAVLVLLGLAGLNRFHLTGKARRDTRPLMRSIAAECVLVLLILGLVAGWRFTPPPRPVAAATVKARARMHVHTEKAMLALSVEPGRAGENSVDMTFFGAEGGALDLKEVSLAASLPSAGIAALKRQATRTADGHWRIDGAPFPQPGRWHLKADGLVTDFDEVTLEGDVEIKP